MAVGKFANAVRATSHMRSGQGSHEDEGERVEPAPVAPNPSEPPAALRAAGQGRDGVERRGPGRPKGGKRSNPDFQQVTALVPSELYTRVRTKLLDKKKTTGDFSDLVSKLLENWLLSQV